MSDDSRARERGALVRRAVERGARTEYLAFRLADETYAVPIAYVKEILKLPPLTEVPRAPFDVMGVISVRGRIVTVRDLRRRLRVGEAPATRKSRVLLAELPAEVQGGGERVGLFVDEVLHVHRLSESEVESATSALGSDLSEYVAGIGRPVRRDANDAEMIILVDVKSVLMPAARATASGSRADAVRQHGGGRG